MALVFLESQMKASHNGVMESEPQRLEIHCTVDAVTTRGFILRRDLERGERIARAGKIFGVFFLTALLTVFIPILHFILPPLALIVGGVLATGEYMGTGDVLSGEIDCPNCKKKIEFARDTEEWPRIQRCPGCS